MGAHARKRQVSTIRGVGGSRVNVYAVPDWCGAIFRSVSAFQNWACIHVCRCALTVGARGMCSGSVLAAPLRAYIIIIIIFRWVATIGSTGYERPHRRVRIGA